MIVKIFRYHTYHHCHHHRMSSNAVYYMTGFCEYSDVLSLVCSKIRVETALYTLVRGQTQHC